ncbi:MAG: hypothetical protein Q4F74_00390 [Synergistaceae bacterium]|nr:hypothetical protein [Synergistaceae bacterium]
MREKSLLAFVDSINGDICRVLLGAGSAPVDIPLALLPPGIEEGSSFMVKFTEPRVDLERKNRVAELIKEMETGICHCSE